MNADQQIMNEMAALLKERNELRSQVRELREALEKTVRLEIEPGMIATGSQLVAAIGTAKAALAQTKGEA